jgi:hypothetical protein
VLADLLGSYPGRAAREVPLRLAAAHDARSA